MGATKELYISVQDDIMNTIHQVEGGELSHLDGLIRLRQNKSKLEDSLEMIKEFESDNLNRIEQEAGKYPEGYCGYEIKSVSGRKTYAFKDIPEHKDASLLVKNIEDKYRAAFDGAQKGIIQITKLNENDPDSPLGWVDEDGEVLPFPALSIGKSYLTVTLKKQKK